MILALPPAKVNAIRKFLKGLSTIAENRYILKVEK